MSKVKMVKVFFLIFTLLFVPIVIAQTCKSTIPASSPDSRFDVNGNEVTDNATGLIWQRCSYGQTGIDCSGGSANPYDWLGALQVVVSPWRLPNRNELRSIVEEKCYSPSINLTIFPNTIASYYVSASPKVDSSDLGNNSDKVWYVNFQGGSAHYGVRSFAGFYVRLVRDAVP